MGKKREGRGNCQKRNEKKDKNGRRGGGGGGLIGK